MAPFGILLAYLAAWLALIIPSPFCTEAPKHRPETGMLTQSKHGMGNATVYTNSRLYRSVKDAVDVADRAVAYVSQTHIETRRAHMSSLGQIGLELQATNRTLQGDINLRKRYPPSEQELENFELKIKIELNKAESTLVRLLSSRRSLIQERDGAEFDRAEAQVAKALDSISRFKHDGHHAASVSDVWCKDYERKFGTPFPGCPSNARYQYQHGKNNARAQMKGAFRACKKLLAGMEDWKPLNTQTNAEWDMIDARMREYKQHRDSLDLEIAIRNLSDVTERSWNNLAEEMEVFMKTWGPVAGYHWEQVKRYRRVRVADAIPCRNRTSKAQEDDRSWFENLTA